MGILLVYDVSDEQSFTNVRNWMRQIDQNAAENVTRILIGNKCDVDSSDRVSSHTFPDDSLSLAVPTFNNHVLIARSLPFFQNRKLHTSRARH